MKKKWRVVCGAFLSISMSVAAFAAVPTYYDEQEYTDALNNNFTEDTGIVVENNPSLGYITYKDSSGKIVTRNYYASEVTVEKQPYYETEDTIGYIDEMFPHFQYDPRDTTINSILAGDCVYVRTNSAGEVTYISAFNDYVVRYGKVISYNFNTGETAHIMIEDEYGNIYSYDLGLNLPVTKGGTGMSISAIETGQWVKLLVSQRILGQGNVNEKVEEVVIDNNTRYISNVYRGQITSIDTYKNNINIKDVQALGKTKWGIYNDLLALNINPNSTAAYVTGSRVSTDYINRNLRNAEGYVYVAAETYKGKETAVKLNFQSKLQTTLSTSTVISASTGVIKLLSGETLYVAEDAIIVRNNRLVDANSIMVGDKIQAVVSGENKLAVANVSNGITTGSLQIFRGRIKEVEAREEFVVETFSELDESTWYYYPTPRTFSIDNDTKFYSTTGYVQGGINSFLGYGSDTTIGEVYTIVAIGEKAYMVIDMPYTRHAIKGKVYQTTDESLSLKDVYYYDDDKDRWRQYSNKNRGITVDLAENGVVIKEGSVSSLSRLEEGDAVTIMLRTSLADVEEDEDGETELTGYIVTVEN